MTLSPADYAERLAALTQNVALMVWCVLLRKLCALNRYSVRSSNWLRRAFVRRSEAGDQRRIMTPEQALSAGVDYMVIGRPVTQSVDPAQTLKAINASLQRSA